MDNNMIHIDDLVRQRLRGGEEPERPGAWLTMRELLDKEMPVSAGYNWRRIMGYFTALLLLTTASVGGYRMYSNNAAGTRIAIGGGRDEEGSNYGTPVAGNVSIPEHANPLSQEAASTKNPVSTTSVTVGNSQPASKATRPTASNAGSMVATVTNRSTNLENQVKATDAKPAAANANTRNAGHNAAENSARPVSTNLYSASGATVNGRHLQAAPANLSANNVSTLGSAPEASAGTATSLPMPRPTVVIKHDTIERLELVYRRVYDDGNQKMYYRIDTFPVGKIVVDRILPAIQAVAVANQPAKPHRGILGRHRNEDQAKVSGSTPSIAVKQTAAAAEAGTKVALGPDAAPVVPATTLATRTPEQEVGTALVSLASARVSTKRFSLWDADKVDAAINKFKFNLAKIQMYPGVMGGINASMFTPNALGGFQLGLTSLFVLNDWWSLMTEFKYIQRFNTGSSVRDDYMQVKDGSGQIATTTINGQQYLGYTWTDQHVQHSFNYDVVKTFEVPLMLRYNWGRIYGQGGVNLVFSSAIAAKEVTNPVGDFTSHTEYRPNVHTPDSFFITNDHPNVLISDFGRHFGTGYVISGGYMFSPAVYFDVRVTQTFWDNSKTTGAKQVSNDLLRTPSIQLSVGYRFNSTKTK